MKQRVLPVLAALVLGGWALLIFITGKVTLKRVTFDGVDAQLFGFGLALLAASGLCVSMCAGLKNRKWWVATVVLWTLALGSFVAFLYRNV